MKAIERPDIAEFYLQRIRDLMLGNRIMSEVRYDYERKPDIIHASEIDDGTCPLQAYYHRVLPESNVPPIADISVLLFLRGRVVERAIASECETIEVNGIGCRPDDHTEDFGYSEIKSCWKDSTKFNPADKEKGYPHWIQRIKTYCYVTEQLTYNLVVMFMIGNTWTTKWNSPDRVPCALKAWRLEFDQDEVNKNWLTMLNRRDLLLKAIDSGISILWGGVPKRLPPWGCRSCQFTSVCEYYDYQLKQAEL